MTNESNHPVVGIKAIAICIILLSFCGLSILQSAQFLDSMQQLNTAKAVQSIPQFQVSSGTAEDTKINGEEQIFVDEQETKNYRAPDFGIIGYPKTGTTFLLYALRRHPEVVMPSEEFCQPKKWFEEMRNISSRPQSTSETHTRYGFKCAPMLKSTKQVEDLVQIANRTRLVMGVRHPVEWFESFYNYRVLEWYLYGFNDIPIPSPFELTGKDTHWRDVSVKYARFDIYMKQLAKVSLTDKEMREMLDHDSMFPKRMSLNPYKIFIYTMEQVNDRNDTRRLAFQQDLQKFLQLRSPLDDFASLPIINPGNSTFNERINICDQKYSTIRSQLIQQGKQASKWIVSKFVESPDVVVSNAEFFKSALREWGKDSCKKKEANGERESAVSSNL
ncbi:hypothetical protein ACHAXM_000850 [Skeletonema potamos]